MRRKLVQFHIWLALIFGFLWALQGLTGSLIVFAREVDRVTAPAFTSGPMRSLDEILAGAQHAVDGAFIHRLAIADGERRLIYALYQDREGIARAVVMDPAAARPLDIREWEPKTPFGGEITRWVYWLHLTLLSGDTGKKVSGIIAIVLVTGLILGLWIAWPKRGSWKFVFMANRWRTKDQRLYGWHRAIGLAFGLVLVPLAAAGAYLALPTEPVRQFVAGFAPYVPNHGGMGHGHRQHRREPTDRQTIPPQQALDRALQIFPDAQWVRVMMPTRHEPTYTVRMHQPGETRAWLGTTSVVVDGYSGELLGTYDPLTAPLSNRIFDAIWSFHNGELFGLTGRILAVVIGVALPFLYVVGLWRWLLIKRKRLKSTVTAPQAAPHFHVQ
jgi:uncharacterized iron-regulated membrane protein